jgi:hypothetical protein
MPDQALPAELREFLASHIDSIAELEALLLVRESRDAVWDVQSLAKRLYIDEQQATEVLSQLGAHGFVEGDADGCRYAPASQDLDRLAGLLADYYRRHLIPITELVHAKTRRIRQFADAFKLKKKD